MCMQVHMRGLSAGKTCICVVCASYILSKLSLGNHSNSQIRGDVKLEKNHSKHPGAGTEKKSIISMFS